MAAVSGIYRWKVSRGAGCADRFYIGQAVNIYVRKRDHLWMLKSGRHKNKALQEAYDAHGEANFEFSILAECDRQNLTEKEQEFVDLHTEFYGRRSLYNALVVSVNSRLGQRNSPEQNAKIGATHRNRVRKEEELQRLRTLMIGRKLSADAIAKRSAKQRGRRQSVEERAMRSRMAMGRTLSAESRAKISATKRALGQCPTPEARAKGLKVRWGAAQ